MQGQKTGGRTKGTPNKLTTEFRDKLKSILFDELETLPEQLAALQPEQRLNIIIKLLPYVAPKVDSVTPHFGEPDNWGFSGVCER